MIAFISILFTCFIQIASPFFLPEKELKTEIKEVTVFLTGAQVFESGSITIPQGESVLTIKSRSPFMDEKSLQVKGIGEFTILAVNQRTNFLETPGINKNDSLQTLLEKENIALDNLNAQTEVLKEKLNILNANKNLGGQNNGITMVQLKQAIDFFEKEITEIKALEIKNKREASLRQKSIERLEKQLKEANNQEKLPVSEVVIKVHSDRSTKVSFTLSYMVTNAGWFPKYDIRVNTIQEPLELVYKAEVWQNTGNDWTNVKLRFSNGQPNKSGVMPELQKWDLTYARNTVFDPIATYGPISSVSGFITDPLGDPIPGATILAKGTTVGTVSDINGHYSITLPNNVRTLVYSAIGMRSNELLVSNPNINVILEEDIQQLSEVVVTGYDSRSLQGRVPGIHVSQSITKIRDSEIIATAVKENQTTVEIEVSKPYSVPSKGEKLLVDLKKYSIDANYEYYAVPKLDKDAFLIAKITDWEKYSFLQGEANLYFEDAYIGRSILEAGGIQDTISISLGRDRSIAIQREKVEQFSRKRTVGSTISETRGYKITIKNNKPNPLTITLFDQMPVSIVNDISVAAIELVQGKLDEGNGKITWKLDLAGQEQRQLEFQYEVKYPRKERVILE